MNDDFSADATTTASYTVFGSPLEARFEEVGDVDWIRVKGLQKFFFYDVWLFRSTDDDFISYADLSLFNSSSRLIWEPQHTERVPGREGYHHFGDNQDHFVSVASTGSRFSVGGYRLYIRAGDYGGNSVEEAVNFAPTKFNQFASALENNADVDFLKYRLFEGVAYTVNLLGTASNSSHATTLHRMALRLLDSEGNLLEEDDTSGAQQNLSVSFTPNQTAEYIFEVDSDEATGSYILESEQFDDFRSDISTEGLLPADGTPVSGQANYRRTAFFNHDFDWFRFEPRTGFKYEIQSNNAPLTLKDRDGRPISVEYIRETFSDDGQRKFAFTAYSTGPFFVAAGELREQETAYTISANVIDDHIATFRNATRYEGGTADATISGAIETAGDRDWIRIALRSFANYRFTIDADPNLRMAVSIRDEGGEILKDGVPLIPLNYSFVGTYQRELVYLDVRSNANETGTWSLRTQAAQGGSDASTRWNVDLSSGSGRIRSLVPGIENAPELWHRFQVNPNTWYEINSGGVNFDVRRADGAGTVSYTRGKRYYYSGNNSGSDRFIVVDPQAQDFEGELGFEIKIVEDAQLKLPGTRQFSPGNNRFGNQSFGFQSVEVYSSIPFRYLETDQPTQVAANTYRTLSPQEWFSITFDNAFSDVSELYFRGTRANGNSQWSAIELYGHHLPEGVPLTSFDPGPLRYAFAEGKPAYLTDDSIVADVQPLTDPERQSLRNAFFQWSRHSATRSASMVAAGDNNDAAPIMIYKAELESDVLAFSRAEETDEHGIAGDIILNTNSPLWADLSIGTQGPYELLRAVGISMGVDQLTTIGRDQSIMGTELTGDLADLPYPSNLLPADIIALRPANDLYLHPDSNSSEFRLDENNPIYQTIIHNSIKDSFISAESSALNATIDLRPGQSSFLTDGASQPATWIMSKFSRINQARGGSGDDSIRGNAQRNILFGNLGNDTLIGGVGNDFLNGGAGDDYYSYHLGHDNDVISEADAGGTETLRIEGLKNFDGLEDLQFRRFGNNLKITLELDNRDRNADSIVVKDMGTRDSAVERLVLIREGNFLGAVSLQSVWAQTDNQLRRFELGQGSDDFGSLVSPV